MNKLEEKLLQLRGYSYHLARYQKGHSVLTFRGANPDKSNHNVEITFEGVYYFQFPSVWVGDFYPASDSELLEMVKRAGIANKENAMPASYIKDHFHLYKADSPHSTIYVLGHLAQIEYDVQPI